VLHGRRTRALLLTVMTGFGLAGCGETAGTRTVADFRIEAPPLPPLALPGQDATAPASAPARKRPSRSGGSSSASGANVAPGAPSDAEVEAQLREAFRVPEGESADPNRSIVDTATLSSGGIATVPPGAPRAVGAIITAANQVATKPYVYGGGHGRLANEIWVDTAYDCSGSISFAFASAGLIDRPMVSGGLARWGKPGPGKWVTIYANGGHAWMTVGGLRFDTSGLKQSGSRWQTARRSTAGFTVRHPAGL